MSSEESLAVMAYRLGEVEKVLAKVDSKFDSVANLYVTQATLMLTLNPYKEDIRELQEYNKEQEKSRNQFNGQLKLVIIGAFASPFISAVISYIIVSGK